jgi:AcrR family transcriptional regulator
MDAVVKVLGEGTVGKAMSAGNRRDDILREAARLFREKGYERTSVRDLAEAVSMKSGSLFYHFDSKEDILVEVMNEGIANLIARLNRELETALTPRARLGALLRVHLTEVLEASPDAMAVYLFEWQSLSPGARAKLIATRDAYEARIHALLAEVAEAGLIPHDTKLYRLFLLGALNWTATWYDSAGGLGAAAIAERFLTFLLPERP